MKEQTSIPKHKIGRAARLAGTGLQVGVNYLKYKARRSISGDDDKEGFHKDTAKQTYEVFSQLKGGPLKLAQMLSLDTTLMPSQYVDEFSKAQYSAPPLTYPLVVSTFSRELGGRPDQIFDHFEKKAVSGASIGQVHRAEKAGREYAVKVQYPGVADSLRSDLAIIKPIAMRLFELDAKSLDPYIAEVRERLLEETDYRLELSRSEMLAERSRHLPNTKFPGYFPEFSSGRILTMQWVGGEQLDVYAKSGAEKAEKLKIAQALWDFYHHQIHDLRQFHADPHPGNFKVDGGELWVLDFGCTKQLDGEFYRMYFALMNPDVLGDEERFRAALHEIGLLLETDTPQAKDKLTGVFRESVELLSRPFLTECFDFGDSRYFAEIAEFGERTRTDRELSQLSASRGNPNALYLNRTYFGLYNLMGSLGATVTTKLPDFSPRIAA